MTSAFDVYFYQNFSSDKWMAIASTAALFSGKYWWKRSTIINCDGRNENIWMWKISLLDSLITWRWVENVCGGRRTVTICYWRRSILRTRSTSWRWSWTVASSSWTNAVGCPIIRIITFIQSYIFFLNLFHSTKQGFTFGPLRIPIRLHANCKLSRIIESWTCTWRWSRHGVKRFSYICRSFQDYLLW